MNYKINAKFYNQLFQFVFLMKANFAQPKWAALIPIVIMNVVRDHAGNFENTEDQVLAITQTVVDNVKNKKSGSM